MKQIIKINFFLYSNLYFFSLSSSLLPFLSIDIKFRLNYTEKNEIEGKSGLKYGWTFEVQGRMKK